MRLLGFFPTWLVCSPHIIQIVLAVRPSSLGYLPQNVLRGKQGHHVPCEDFWVSEGHCVPRESFGGNQGHLVPCEDFWGSEWNCVPREGFGGNQGHLVPCEDFWGCGGHCVPREDFWGYQGHLVPCEGPFLQQIPSNDIDML